MKQLLYQRLLYERLERGASGGATLSELEAEIGRQAQLLTDVEKEEAWLYAWALRRREERREGRRRLARAWEEERGYGYAGDAGAG
jgi:hypothetical protein